MRGLAVREAVRFTAVGVALKPVLGHPAEQPVRSHDGQAIQGSAQGFPNQFEAVEIANGGKHMRRIGALRAPRFDETEVTDQVQEGVQEQALGATVQQTRTKLTQDRGVVARMVEREAEGILPVDAGTNRGGGLGIGEVFTGLHDGGEGKAMGGSGGVADDGIAGGEVAVLIDHAKVVAHLHPGGGAAAKDGASKRSGVLRDEIDDLRLKGHDEPPCRQEPNGRHNNSTRDADACTTRVFTPRLPFGIRH